MLGGEGDIDAALDSLPTGGNEVEVNLQNLDLNGVVEMDFRLLGDGEWYDAVIASCTPGRSNAGNLQLTFVFQVDDESDLNGVTVMEWAVVDPRQPKALWKIKKIAKRVGLLSDNGLMLTNNPADFVGRRLRFQNRVDREYNPQEPRNKCADCDFPTTPNAAFTPRQ